MTFSLKRVSTEDRTATRKRIRARGMAPFILFRGILGYGAFAFLIDLAWSLFFEHRQIDFHFVAEKTFQWSAAGVFFGWFTWRIEFDPDEDE